MLPSLFVLIMPQAVEAVNVSRKVAKAVDAYMTSIKQAD